MVHILLLILKIILWIFLAVLGLLLLLLLLVLFAPIRYKADIDYHGAAMIKAKVNFLCVSVMVFFDQKEKQTDTTIRIFGIRLGVGSQKPKKSKKNRDDGEAGLSGEVSDDILTDASDEAADDMPMDAPGETADDEIPDIEEKTAIGAVHDAAVKATDKAAMDTDNKKAKKDKHKKEDKHKNKGERVSFSERLEGIKRSAHKFKKFWDLKCTVNTRQYLKRYLIGVAKHVGPRRIKGYVRYGFDDPCTTGKVTGYLSLMPFVYQKGFSLQPDFHEKVIEADVKLKGHFFLGYIIRIVFKRDVWRTIKAARRLAK